MKPGYTTIGHKSSNATSASNRVTSRAHAITKRGVGSAQTHIGQKNALKAKEPSAWTVVKNTKHKSG